MNPYKLKDMAGNIKVFRAKNLNEAKEQAKKQFRTKLVFLA